MNDGSLLVMSYFPTTGRKWGLLRHGAALRRFWGREGGSGALGWRRREHGRERPRCGMPTRIFRCEREGRLWPYVCSGLRCFLRQQMDAVPLLVYWSFSMMSSMGSRHWNDC